MPVASKPAQRARPHLEANMNLIRNLVVNVPHTYWNRHMSPSVTWTVYITHVLPPANKNQLRMRLVAEARQTLAEGEGEGMVIGPHVRLTRLLVELEKETKRDNPPKYYRYRPETSRKACDQLKVAGMTGSPWLLKEYLQGEKLLTEAVLPPRSMRVPDFVPTFTDAQLEQLVSNRPPSSSRGSAKRGAAGAAPDRRLRQRNADVCPVVVAECACHGDAPLAASSVAVRTCSRCPAGVFMSIKGSGKTRDAVVETGFACEQCQGSLCGSCVFAELATFAQRRDLREHLAIEAPCACGTLPQRGPAGERLFMATAAVAPAAWFGDPEVLRDCAASAPYVLGDGAALDVERLERDLSRAHDERLLLEAWLRTFDTAMLHRCGNEECRALSLLDTAASGGEGPLPCSYCDARTCPVCGSTEQPHICPVRRPALLRAGSGREPWAAEHALESCAHTLLRGLTVPCGAALGAALGACGSRCEQRVFPSATPVLCTACDASSDVAGPLTVHRRRRCVSTVVQRLREMEFGAARPLSRAEQEAASDAGATAYQAQHVVRQLRYMLQRSPLFEGLRREDRREVLEQLEEGVEALVAARTSAA